MKPKTENDIELYSRQFELSNKLLGQKLMQSLIVPFFELNESIIVAQDSTFAIITNIEDFAKHQ
ncbi:MAG: hypothetical protein M9949_01695 [Candidatus Kapabacteria bacterium]|nr:hypothetical protein [Candidatus Kapabacteria bacterium]